MAANETAAFDMADFVDFGDTSLPGVSQGTDLNVMEPTLDESHPFGEGDAGALGQSTQPTDIDFNTDFSTWLPTYHKSAQPCDYCKSMSLECFIYNVDGTKQLGCSPCNALFRPCSFVNPEMMPAMTQRTALDILDIVAENDTRCLGGLTGKKQMRSLGHVGPITDELHGDPSTKKATASTAARFPQAAVKILKDWMLAHIYHPYPTDEDKELLKQQTGLSIGQISNWMANTRRRQKARPKPCASPSLRPSTKVIDIPAGKTWENMGPFERWKHSPPENEPAPLNAIAHAVKTFDPPEANSQSSSYRKDVSNDSTGSFSVFKAPSISSLETGLTRMSPNSLGSRDSAYSHGSRHSLGSLNSLKAKERRRRRRIPARVSKPSLGEEQRVFQCTFCTDSFKSKYDWSRHEKSLHLSLEKWLCAPLGEMVADKATGKPRCVYCDELDPSKEHLATHNHTACYEKGPESRTFYRKDHLRQHLRLMHGCKMSASMETWKSEAQYIKSRCGFCGMNFDKWQDRVDHLAKEFRNGANMKNWKGCRGLAPHVAIYVTNAMPPYLIAHERNTPFPFSATNSASLKQQTNLSLDEQDLAYLLPNNYDLSIAYQDGEDSSRVGPIMLSTPKDFSPSGLPDRNPNATCWEILTLRLGRFARGHIEQNGAGSVTDEMLQVESRRILYGDDDAWNQTSADNPEWLNLFKRAHGIDTKAPVKGIGTPLDVYEDLGINTGAAVNTSFNMNNFACEDLPENDPLRALSFECSLSGSLGHIRGHARQLSSGRQTPYSLPGLSRSPTSPLSCAPVTTAANHDPLMGVCEPISELAYPSKGKGPCFGEDGQLGFSMTKPGSPKRRYWLDETNTHMSLFASATDKQQPVYECATDGLRSLEPSNHQQCDAAAAAAAAAATSRDDDLQFPSWDQLPEHLQNPTSSAEYNHAGVSASATADNVLATQWDDTMDFAMDMDMDMDLDLDLNLGLN